MKIVGLDLAAKTGIAVIVDGDISETLLTLPKEKDGDRFKRWHEYSIFCAAMCEGADLVVIEHYAMGFRGAAITLIEQGAIIRHALWKANLRFIEVPPSTLKKFVTGSGNAKKADMIRCVKAHWNFETKDDNIADAVGLAKLGEMMLSKRTPDELARLREQYGYDFG